jgi:hypothetical protein
MLDAEENNEGESYTPMDLKSVVAMLTEALKLPMVENDDEKKGLTAEVESEEIGGDISKLTFFIQMCLHNLSPSFL